MAVRQLDKGKYQLIVDYYDADGNRHKHTKVVYCRGKKEAKELLKQYEETINAGYSTEMTVEELLTIYIGMKEVKGIKKTTAAGYNACKRRIVAELGKYPAIDLTTLHVNRFVINCVKVHKNSSKTIRNLVSLLDSAYKMAIRNKILPSNPCEYVEIPKITRPDIVTLSEEEILQFIDKLQDEDLDFKVMCELALFCGLRRSEIMGLRVDDINLTFGTVRIARSRHRLNGEEIIQDTKTERSRRTLYLPNFLRADVAALIKEHARWSDCEYLIQYFGEPMKPDKPVHDIKKFVRKNGLPDVTLHGLRHTFATMLNASGEFDFADISAALGHSNITTTMSIYVDVFGGATHSARRISDSIENKFGKNGAKMVHEA